MIKLSVYGVVINEDDEILLQKRANTHFANGWWSLPGGHVENKESLSNAIVREVNEECGIDVNPDFCSVKLTLIRKPEQEHRYINFFCIIKNWNGIPVISDGKASELLFFPKNDLPHPILSYIEEALSLIEKGIQFHESEY